MREIIFRGKHIDGYGWETGDLIHNGDDRFTMTFIGGIAVSHDTHTDEISFDGHWLAEVDPATVGQYTGLKDRNGVRIFEGDIFRCKDARGYVRFGTYASAYSSGDTHVGFFIEWIVDRMLRIDLAFWTNQREIEVGGNIHDNPELLEVQND